MTAVLPGASRPRRDDSTYGLSCRMFSVDDGGWDRDYRQRGRLYRRRRRLPPLPDGARVLEIGCGDGRALAALGARPCTVVGLDLFRPRSPSAARRAHAPRPLLVRGDARRLPFPERVRSTRSSSSTSWVTGARTSGDPDCRRGRARDRTRGQPPPPRLLSRGPPGRAGLEVEEGSRLRARASSPTTSPRTRSPPSSRSCRALRLETIRWHLRVRGAALPRAEIEAVFEPRRPGTANVNRPPIAKRIIIHKCHVRAIFKGMPARTAGTGWRAMSPRNRMILCLVCLAAVGLFCVAGCTTTPPKGNATPNATAAPTMNNTILKINNNQAPNITANASTTVGRTRPRP